MSDYKKYHTCQMCKGFFDEDSFVIINQPKKTDGVVNEIYIHSICTWCFGNNIVPLLTGKQNNGYKLIIVILSAALIIFITIMLIVK